ncbi:hypothetical protein EVAR_68490_1 [Eumeta japonica]|uniref:Uncharacterized protein n=1 Tax=Eumeta variegata TaxID=151549 RepID=A0A4C1ZXG1_EUMVA|nr:hypothetical protein EVAR_68490_1 [Eumeta japonica]
MYFRVVDPPIRVNRIWHFIASRTSLKTHIHTDIYIYITAMSHPAADGRVSAIDGRMMDGLPKERSSRAIRKMCPLMPKSDRNEIEAVAAPTLSVFRPGPNAPSLALPRRPSCIAFATR